MVRVAHQDQDSLDQNVEEKEEEVKEENGSQNTGDHNGVTIRNIEEERPGDCGFNSVGISSPEDRVSSTDAICVRSDSEARRLDSEDVSHASSTQYSDVDDSLEGSDELGSWSNDLNVPVSLQQSFDNGVSLPISEVPSFGDVCVKNSANVHFGNKTFYNGPVTIKQIVYANPNLTAEEGTSSCDDTGNGSDNKPHKNGTSAFPEDGYPSSGRNGKTANTGNVQDDDKGTQWCAWLLTWRCVALMCAMGSCLVASVVVSVVLLSRDSGGSPSDLKFPQIPSGSTNVPSKLRFVERAEWGAQPPTEPLDKLKLPVPYVVISHTVTDFCKTQSECTFRVRFAQTFHIESRGWSDIAYNFLVGGDGYAYVGRGWDYVGAHTYNYNVRSIGISFIGTFNTVIPPKEQLFAAQELIKLGVKAGKISPDYILIAHRQVSSTLSPGDALYSVIKTWPHWTNISST